MRKLVAAAGLALVSAAARGGAVSLQSAVEAPEWFTRGVVYQIQPRSFTPEGTLKAATAKLDHLKDIGATVAYLVPVFKMDESEDRSFWSPRQIRSGFNNPKNQYRISDYYHVDAEYGTDADLRAFCDRAHELGMKVLFDLVYFHAGPTARVWRQNPSFTKWNADGTISKGEWRFPRFDFRLPAVREYLWNNMTYNIIEFGADGYRCDVGDGIPLDFWQEGRRRMRLLKPESVLLCEGFSDKSQEGAFDADYGWFPGEGVLKGKSSAKTIRRSWEGRERNVPKGARFVNHYENHDTATDVKPRREAAWGTKAVDQTLVWMFTIDGVPMIFTGNEIADADAKHSMFGKTPLDWSQAEREPGKSRLELVRKLAKLRAENAEFTAFNGREGLSWLDVTEENKATAFVRRDGKGGQIVVVQNWSAEEVELGVSFKVAPEKVPSYLSVKAEDRSVKGKLAPEPLLARDSAFTGPDRFRLGPWGFAIHRVAR